MTAAVPKYFTCHMSDGTSYDFFMDPASVHSKLDRSASDSEVEEQSDDEEVSLLDDDDYYSTHFKMMDHVDADFFASANKAREVIDELVKNIPGDGKDFKDDDEMTLEYAQYDHTSRTVTMEEQITEMIRLYRLKSLAIHAELQKMGAWYNWNAPLTSAIFVKSALRDVNTPERADLYWERLELYRDLYKIINDPPFPTLDDSNRMVSSALDTIRETIENSTLSGDKKTEKLSILQARADQLGTLTIESIHAVEDILELIVIDLRDIPVSSKTMCEVVIVFMRVMMCVLALTGELRVLHALMNTVDSYVDSKNKDVSTEVPPLLCLLYNGDEDFQYALDQRIRK